MSRLIDLSQPIYEGMKVYPGHLKTVTFQHVTHEETAPRFTSDFSFQTWGFMLNDNGPTHVDSFSHLDPRPVGADDRSDGPRPVLRARRMHRRLPYRTQDRHHLRETWTTPWHRPG